MMSSYFIVRLTLLLVLGTTVYLGHITKPCNCKENQCDCEDLSYIPKLPLNTTSVEIRYATFHNLDNETLVNLTTLPLQQLSFVGCMFLNSSEGVFSGLRFLQRLKFSICNLPENILSEMFKGLSSTNISSLELHGVNLQNWNEELFKGMENTNLVHLTLSKCSLTSFNGTDLSSLKKLKELDLSFNSISLVSSWGYHPYLNKLDLYGNCIFKMPHFRNGSKGISALPTLKNLSLSLYRWRILNKYIFLGLKQLEELAIDAPDLILMEPRTLTPLCSLKRFSLSSTKYHRILIGVNAFKSRSLQSLILQNFKLMLPGFKQDTPFDECRQIDYLKLSGVTIIGRKSINDILKLLTKLKYLEISKSIINSVPDTVCNMANLKTLILSYTRIRKWVQKNCHSMKSLTKISLSNNHAYRFNRFSFSKALLKNSKLKWDLSYNAYICDCKLVWFRNWVKRYSGRMLRYPKYYLCSDPPQIKSIRVANFYLTWDYCLRRYRPSVFAVAGITLGTLSIIFIICGVVSYVKRWSIRYLFYLVWARKRKYETLHNKIEYDYDAFVCYSGFDVRWVLNHLLPILEEEKHLHLCLHDRDFKVGHDIVDNIVESIQQSRKVVLILSAEFARSRWCQFEASLAQQRLLEEEKDVIVPILLNEIPSDIQTNRLALLLKKKTYLEWSEHQHGQKLFWERLIDILLEEPSYEEF